MATIPNGMPDWTAVRNRFATVATQLGDQFMSRVFMTKVGDLLDLVEGFCSGKDSLNEDGSRATTSPDPSLDPADPSDGQLEVDHSFSSDPSSLTSDAEVCSIIPSFSSQILTTHTSAKLTLTTQSLHIRLRGCTQSYQLKCVKPISAFLRSY